MKNFIKGFLLLIIIVGLSLLMPGLMDSTKYDVQAGEAEWFEEEFDDDVDPFTIVEIVPYKGIGEIGYLIGGEEPVDQELMDVYTAPGLLSFLGGAIDVYYSYEEKEASAFGRADTDWLPAKREIAQNGYFEYVGYNNGGYYSIRQNTLHYKRVADGAGDYDAVPQNMETTYELWAGDVVNKRNVNAYFVYGQPNGVELLNTIVGYTPASVKENPTHTGDYNYDPATRSFYLARGTGKYDVLFKRAYYGNLYYIMKDNLSVVEDGTGLYSFSLDYVRRAGGNYAQVRENYFEFDQYGGTYRFVPSNNLPPEMTSDYFDDGNGRIWVRNQKVTVPIQFHYQVQLVNNEWFKTHTLGISSLRVDDYPVDVITITPEELNTPGGADIIDKADLFYINANYNHNSAYFQLYEEYSHEGRNLPAGEKYYNTSRDKGANINFALHDISWENVIRIFKRVAGIGCTKAGLIMDSTFYLDAISNSSAYAFLRKSVTLPFVVNGGSNATMCNMAKLYIMVYQRNMIDFYNAFLQTENPDIETRLITQVNTSVNTTGTTGSFIRPDMEPLDATADAAIYWNGNTFLPYGLNSEGKMVRYTENAGDTATLYDHGILNYNITATTTDLTNNVLTLNGSDFFTAKFIQPVYIPSDSQDTAKEDLGIVNEDGTVLIPTDFTLGDLVNVIINEGSGYGNIGGIAFPDGGSVEGPPSDNPQQDEEDTTDDGTDGSGLRSYKRVLNIQPTADFTDSENTIKSILSKFSVQIVNMTSTQFNSCIEDINSKYDMIYMGTGYGRFNLSGGNTVFNEIASGNYYFTTGDLRRVMISNTMNLHYRGNDITAQKRSELESYLDAGLPIVLDPKLYNRTGISNAANLNSFIQKMKGEHPGNFLNAADASSSNLSTRLAFNAKLNNALDTVRPSISLISPQIPEGSAVNYTYVDAVTHRLTVKFSILPKGKFPSACTFDAYLYIDENGDGIFTADEQLETASSDEASTMGLTESKSRIYSFIYNMERYNGVYQWKLEVRRSDNSAIHSMITGYAANSEKEQINILHIRSDASSYDLRSRINDAQSLIYQYAGDQALQDFTLNIESMTKSELEQLYVKQRYTTATTSKTNRLNGYHLLIIEVPIDDISNSYGARSNICDEAADGLSIIFTKDAISHDNQGDCYSSDQYSFEDNYTYNYLNLHALINNNNKYYIYHSLDTNGDLSKANTYQTTYLTKANEGTITRYPYQIDKGILCAANSFSDYTLLDYNLPNKYDSDSRRLIGWYCLSDKKDPYIRSRFATGVEDEDLYEGVYSSSPNDVKNNYYLFSNGLCYYSGITLSSADVAGNDEEIKLFINTIIAAYQATDRVIATAPVIRIMDPVPVSLAPEDSYDIYYIKNVGSSLYMEVKDASTENSAIIQQNAFTGGECQRFKIVPAGNGYYYIYTGSSGYVKAVDVKDNKTADGTSIIQNDFHGENNQQFEIVEISNGKYAIKTKITGSASCLENSSGRMDANNPVIQNRYQASRNQLWYLVPAAEDVIEVSGSDIKEGSFDLTFNISESSSNMDMTILLNGADVAGSWNDTIYKKTGETIGSAISIKNTGKVVANGTYVLRIPAEYVATDNVLTFKVVNREGSIAYKNVRMIYAQKPVVEIENPKPVADLSKGFLYVDVDYNSVDTDEDYLDAAPDLKVIFSVDKSGLDYLLSITSEGADLTGGAITVTDENGNVVDLAAACPGGGKAFYTMHIPVALMKKHSSREIVITATNTSGYSGEASVTLLRRSLFPLD